MPRVLDKMENIIAPVDNVESIHLVSLAEPVASLPVASSPVASSAVASLPVASSPVKRTTKKIPDDTRKKVKELSADGKSVRQIATILGISKTTAATIVNEMPKEVAVVAQILSPNTIEPMDDASFANAITSSVPTNTIAPKSLSKGSIDKILADFGNLTAEPLSKKAKGKGTKSTSGLDAFLDEFSEPETKAKPMKARSQMVVQSEEFQDKSVYIAKIQMNVDNFADVLKDHIKPDRDGFLTKISKMSLSDLNSTLKLLETVRSSNNMANQMKYLLYGGANFIELGSQKFLGMKTQGYAQQLRQQEAEIQSCLREIAINNVEAYKKIEKPEMRLATVLITTLIATDSRNRLEGLRNEFKNKPVSKEQEDKFNEL
jgi:hypothetical protein